ncbi:GIY-YIG nuclease family protein [Paenibacillus residui]|uniref:GIY-YIG nuclease family protein n=1 Tax=Paenibacillus residui TaxID=629724 RepID=A0ABW3DE19_9BACL
MNLRELIQMRNLDTSHPIKLVRHQHKVYSMETLHDRGFICFYQSNQSKDVFKDCNYILAFIGAGGTKAKYIGAYEKIGSGEYLERAAISLPSGFPYQDIFNNHEYGYKYQLKKIDLLKDLENRLIIDWGKSTLKWDQWLGKGESKKVVEIYPEGYVNAFPGFDQIILSYQQLRKIIKNPDANRQWHLMLSSVSGVYLILDSVDGRQYIGSASGEEGILGRWRNYADIPHGHNALLKELLERDPERYNSFQFSILCTLPRSMPKSIVVSQEQIYKQKLGSRAFGLNAN